ncbi:MAG: hypothetical protein Q9202_006370 [Teloschistes flavicans]
MLLRIYVLSLALLSTSPFCLGTPLPKAPAAGFVEKTPTLAFPSNLHHHPESPNPSVLQARRSSGGRPQRRDNEWQLVLTDNLRAISPFHAAAADMREFYRLVGIAASTTWAAHFQPRNQLHIVWNRISMVLVVVGIDAIPWTMVATFAATMYTHLNRPGTIANTYDCYYLKVGQGVGFYAGLRMWDMQEAVDFFLNRPANTLDPGT